MKKLFKQGFTMVELLIVIAVIAILAIAVLAALDPVEQLRKSRDTGKMADARELINAYQRFQTAKGCLPNNWGPPCNALTPFFYASSNAAPVTTDITEMNTERELKDTFSTKQSVTAGHLFVGTTAAGIMSVCFNAESRNAQQGALSNGQSGTIVPATGVTTFAAAAIANCTNNPYSPTTRDDGCLVCVQ